MSNYEAESSKATVDPETYYKQYYEAGQAVTMGKKKEEVTEDTHEEMVEKLEKLESKIQQGTKKYNLASYLTLHDWYHAICCPSHL